MRAELSADERREHLIRRKELWQARQADAEAENSGAPCATIGGRPKGFAAEKAAALGKSKSQINRLIAGPKAEGKKLKPEPKGVATTVTLPDNTIKSARNWYAAKYAALAPDQREAEQTAFADASHGCQKRRLIA